MIGTIFKTVLIMSAVGSVLTAVLMLLRPITKKFFTAAWNYYIWVAVLATMLMPVSIKPREYAPERFSEYVQYEAVYNQTEQQTDWDGMFDTAGAVWLCVASILFVFKLAKYISFADLLYKNSILEKYEELNVYKTDMIEAPLVIGLFKPKLFLPIYEMEKQDMDYVLAHELTHYKRCDVAVKWLTMAVCTMHWFNPFSYMIAKRIDEECEISCDISVTESMSEEQKRRYMSTILKLMSDSKNSAGLLTTQMAGNKKVLIRRFKMIKDSKRKGKIAIICSAVIGSIAVITGVVSIGVINGRVNREQTVQTLPPIVMSDNNVQEDTVPETETVQPTTPTAAPMLIEQEQNNKAKKTTVKKNESAPKSTEKPTLVADTEKEDLLPKLVVGTSVDEVEQQLNALYTAKYEEGDGRTNAYYWQGGDEHIIASYADGVLETAHVADISDTTKKYYEDKTTIRTLQLIDLDPQQDYTVMNAENFNGNETYVYDSAFVEKIETGVPSSMTVTRASEKEDIIREETVE